MLDVVRDCTVDIPVSGRPKLSYGRENFSIVIVGSNFVKCCYTAEALVDADVLM